MIDLHSHILPGIDDGAPDLEVSLEMARAAVQMGTQLMVATPHVSFDYPVMPADIGPRVGALNVELSREQIPLAVLPGAELALSRVAEMSDGDLQRLCLGGRSCVLVESPYVVGMSSLEEILFDIQIRGFRVLLAHPERSPLFQQDLDRLSRLVERGILCSITAGSMSGQFGKRVRGVAIDMLVAGLVHDVSSDCHENTRRTPALLEGFRSLEEDVPGIYAHRSWFLKDAPAAVLAGSPLPPRPHLVAAKPPRWRRLARRR